jgi:hypothetical protein
VGVGVVEPTGSGAPSVGDKGLKKDALGFVSSFKSCYDLSKPENSESGDSWFGLGPPLVIGVGFLLLGVILMLLWRIEHKDFFKRKPEVYGMARQGPTVTE